MRNYFCGLVFASLICLAADQPAAPKTTNTRTALEEKFQKTLANATLDGRWCMIEKGKLTEEYQDKYTIQGATRSGNGLWLIYARIQYAGRDLTVPVPVQLKWAGDTPVITLDKVSVPGLGTYSARVLIFENTYAGTWSARDHGGMLHGIIEKSSSTAPAKAQK